jgi:leucine efflux protein
VHRIGCGKCFAHPRSWVEDLSMLGVTDFWTYVLGTVAIILLPGPNSIYVLSTAARYGVRVGYRAAAGVFLGDWVLMGAAALGVASLLRAYPPVFLVIKYAGAAYLAYVGVTMGVTAIRRWRRRTDPSAPAVAQAPPEPEPAGPGRPFRRALVISLLNPKAILFVISFFIQFLDPTYPYPALSFLLLASVLQVCSAVYLSALIFGGTYLAAQFRTRRRLASGLTAGVGALFIGFGIRLATASLS